MTLTPQFCKNFIIGERCCEFECLDPPGEDDKYQVSACINPYWLDKLNSIRFRQGCERGRKSLRQRRQRLVRNLYLSLCIRLLPHHSYRWLCCWVLYSRPGFLLTTPPSHSMLRLGQRRMSETKEV